MSIKQRLLYDGRDCVFVRVFSLILSICIFGFMSVGECRDFIFVVNASQSMNDSDPLHVVQESLTWSLENFSEDDEIAVIAFNDTPKVIRPLSKIGDVPNEIFRLEYSGLSNAGAALLQAVDLLASKFDTERNIIVISNGEILLDDSAETLKSAENFRAGLQQARWLNIPVRIINLRYGGDSRNFYSFAEFAEEISSSQSEFMTTIRTIMHNDFETPHIHLPITKRAAGTVSVKVPDLHAKQLKLLLLSSNVGSCSPKNQTPDAVVNEKFLKIFKINSPQTTEFDFDVNYPQGTGLTFDAVFEVEGSLLTDLTFSVFSGNVLEVTPVEVADRQTKILSSEYFDGKSVRVKINDRITRAQIHDGTITVALDGFGNDIALQKIFFEDLGLTFTGDDRAQLKVPDRNYLPWILATAAILTILTLSQRLYRKNHPRSLPTLDNNLSDEKIPPPVEVKKSLIRNKNFQYKGELVIGVTKSPDGEYLAPRTFNLFRLENSEPLSLNDVLKSCGLELDFRGITISPSANGVYVENFSDCPLVKLNNPIAKGAYVELRHEDSFGIASVDGKAELVVTYRSLKPN